jgi:prepilin-type N-terminal cleavage/methylation domain-containing protein
MNIRNTRGVTLIEVLMVVVISAIAMFALVPPFIAEGNFFRQGKRQTEAQRDAQMALRAMAFVAREATGYSTTADSVDFFNTSVCGMNPVTFHADAALQDLHMHCGGVTTTLIDGVRSRVDSFTPSEIISNKLVRIQLDVSHRLRTGDPYSENEVLDTDLFLRNGT